MTKRGWIYCLTHDREIRYVGLTVCAPKQRLRGHINGAKRGEDTYVGRWIRSVGCDVQIQPLADLDDSKLDEAEVAWIAYFRSIGCRLVNVGHGGRRGDPGRRGTGLQASCVRCHRLLKGPKKVARGCKCGQPRVVVNKPQMYPASCVCHRRTFASVVAISRHLKPTSEQSRARYAEAARRREQLLLTCDLCGKTVRGKGALTHHRDRGKCRYARRERQRRPRGYKNLLKNDVHDAQEVILLSTSGGEHPHSDEET